MTRHNLKRGNLKSAGNYWDITEDPCFKKPTNDIQERGKEVRNSEI